LRHRRLFLAEVVQAGWWALVECFNPQKECYRLILVNAWDGLVLTDTTAGSPQLPRLSISRWFRLAKQLQAEIEWRWRIRAFILDIIPTSSKETDIVLAELLFRPDPGHSMEDVEWTHAEAFFRTCLSEDEHLLLARSFRWADRGMTGGSPGWIHEVLDWVGQQAPFGSTDGIRQIQQWNASSASYLLQLSSKNRTSSWLKIVNPAHSAEYRVTLSLTSIFPEYLPLITSSHDIWGAWLMEDCGPSMEKRELSEPGTVWSLSRRLAELQETSVSQIQRLLESGCTHWNLERIYSGVAAALPLLEEAMEAQDIPGVPRLGRSRLDELCEATEEACYRLGSVGIPDSLIHNDLQLENIIGRPACCRFIDWDQAGAGNPFLTFEQLRVQVPENAAASVALGYRSWWSRCLSPESISAGFALAPSIAIAVQLSSFVASLSGGPAPRRLELRNLRSLTRQLDTALQPIKRSIRRCA
jgi:hypothetical protein